MKTVEEYYEDLLTAFTERAGFRPADTCDLAVRMYALAAQLQALHIQAGWVLDQSFPQTAQGIYLDRHAAMRGITRAPATKAAGVLRFCVDSAPSAPLTIPAGTVCMTAQEIRFQTTEAGVITAGSLWTDVAAEALEAGAASNAVAGAICILTACPVAVTGCTNPEAFLGGSDQESDESLRARVLDSYQRLPNGANAAWYEQTALQHEGVAAVQVVGRARGVGTVDVYVTEESGTPSDDLVKAVQADLAEKREIAVDVKVLSPTETEVAITLEISPQEGTGFETAKEAAEEAVTGLVSGKLLGKPVRLAEIGDRVYHAPGEAKYRISAPAADLDAEEGVLPVLGTLTVTEMEAADV